MKLEAPPMSPAPCPIRVADLVAMKVAMCQELRQLGAVARERFLLHFSPTHTTKNSATHSASKPCPTAVTIPLRVAAPTPAAAQPPAPTEAPILNLAQLEALFLRTIAHDAQLPSRWAQELERRLRAHTPTPSATPQSGTPCHSTGATNSPLSSCPSSPERLPYHHRHPRAGRSRFGSSGGASNGGAEGPASPGMYAGVPSVAPLVPIPEEASRPTAAVVAGQRAGAIPSGAAGIPHLPDGSVSVSGTVTPYSDHPQSRRSSSGGWGGQADSSIFSPPPRFVGAYTVPSTAQQSTEGDGAGRGSSREGAAGPTQAAATPLPRLGDAATGGARACVASSSWEVIVCRDGREPVQLLHGSSGAGGGAVGGGNVVDTLSTAVLPALVRQQAAAAATASPVTAPLAVVQAALTPGAGALAVTTAAVAAMAAEGSVPSSPLRRELSVQVVDEIRRLYLEGCGAAADEDVVDMGPPLAALAASAPRPSIQSLSAQSLSMAAATAAGTKAHAAMGDTGGAAGVNGGWAGLPRCSAAAALTAPRSLKLRPPPSPAPCHGVQQYDYLASSSGAPSPVPVSSCAGSSFTSSSTASHSRNPSSIPTNFTSPMLHGALHSAGGSGAGGGGGCNSRFSPGAGGVGLVRESSLRRLRAAALEDMAGY